MKQRRPLNKLKDVLLEPFIIHEISKKPKELMPLKDYEHQLPLYEQPNSKEKTPKNTVIIIDL